MWKLRKVLQNALEDQGLAGVTEGHALFGQLLCSTFSGDGLAAFAPSWASIYRRCVGHDGLSIRPLRQRNQAFLGSEYPRSAPSPGPRVPARIGSSVRSTADWCPNALLTFCLYQQSYG